MDTVMEADLLPIVGVSVDYTKIPSIPQKKTVALINHFLASTAQFLNKFATVCEERLENINGRIHHMESTLAILEAKLGSIPGLENVTVATSQNHTQENVATLNDVSSTPVPPSPPSSADEIKPIEEAKPIEEPIEEPADIKTEKAVTITVAQHPQYAKYFKMVQVGVPPDALRQKMLMEGLDPELLKNPDAPAPAAVQKSKDDESDFGSESSGSFSD